MTKKRVLPKFVRLGHSCLRLDGKEYVRDAGAWGVHYRFNALGELRSKSTMTHLDNQPLIKVSEKAWRKDNGSYAPYLEKHKCSHCCKSLEHECYDEREE